MITGHGNAVLVVCQQTLARKAASRVLQSRVCGGRYRRISQGRNATLTAGTVREHLGLKMNQNFAFVHHNLSFVREPRLLKTLERAENVGLLDSV